ncbi:MAG: oligosaccharide flippase family protein [Planctomycetes bacterium]|nr:oligosaccharide flippase family protein [Planctomycetota bacterium]
MSRRSLTRATAIVVAGMILGRLTGMVRELSIAGTLGVTPDADLVIIVISIPELLTALLVGGAVGAVLVPEFHRLRDAESPSAAHQFVCQSLLGIGLASVLVLPLLVPCARFLAMVVAPGFEGQQLQRATAIVRVVLIAFPCCTLAAVTTAALQASGRVATASLGTFLFNGVLIVAIVAMLMPGRVEFLGWAVVAAASTRLLSQLAACWHAGLFSEGWQGGLRLTRLNRSLAIRYALALTAISLTMFAPLISRALASLLEGGIATFNYALKLVELPRGLLTTVLTMVFFPRISQLFTSRRSQQAKKTVEKVTRLAILVTLPLAVGLIAGAHPIVSLLFERGQIGPAEVERIAALARIAFAALPALVLVLLAMSVFHAQSNTRFPFVVSLLMTVAHLAVSAALFFAWGEKGLMAALVVVTWLHWLVLAVSLRRRYGISMLGARLALDKTTFRQERPEPKTT